MSSQKLLIVSLAFVSLVLDVTQSAWASDEASKNHRGRGPASIHSNLPANLPSSSGSSVPNDGTSRDLIQIYQSLIRDTSKQLKPMSGEPNQYLFALRKLPALPPVERTAGIRSTSALTVHGESRYPSLAVRHAAIPWAAEADRAGAVFSVK
jgi:hypothetical protein